MSPEDRAEPQGPNLVRRIREGDRSAEDELVARYRRGVTFVLCRSVRDPAAAEDLFQETFRLVIGKARNGEIREPDRLSGFVCSIARNLAIEHFRRVGARRTSGDAGIEGLSSAEEGPLEELLRAERAAIVRRVLSEMPALRDRQILFRFYIAEHDKADICRDLRLTSLHFNRVLFRARERYRQLYEENAEKSRGEKR